jgi:hypothetical protein
MGSFSQFFKESSEGSNIRDQVIDFIAKNPNPKSSAIHTFAEEHELSPNIFEEEVCGVLSDFLTGGKSGGDDTGVDEEQLAKGIEVEAEHTKYVTIRRKIALDHLKEIPNYYDLLEKMEKGANESVAYFYYDECVVNEAGQSIVDFNIDEFIKHGVMKNNKDLSGLRTYLVQNNIINKRDELVFGE